jgi:formylglycine-generating enzyme required for sulfatase activity
MSGNVWEWVSDWYDESIIIIVLLSIHIITNQPLTE